MNHIQADRPIHAFFPALMCRNLNLKHDALGKIYPFLFPQPSLFHPQVHFIKNNIMHCRK